MKTEVRRRWRPSAIAWGIGGVLLPVLLWEGYKAVGPASGVSVGGMPLLPRTTDLAMPHSWTMLERLLAPESSASGAGPMWVAVLQAAGFTLGIAGAGWLLGVVVGLGLAMLMQRFRSANSAMLPWIILSQTVPLIAIAPLVRRWGSQLEFRPVHVGELDVRGRHLRLPGVLSGGHWCAARLQRPGEGTRGPHAHLCPWLVADLPAAQAPGERAVPAPCTAARGRQCGDRGSGGGGFNRAPRRYWPHDRRIRRRRGR